MKINLSVLVCTALVGSSLAQGQSAPPIATAHVSIEEARKPDLTFSNAAVSAAGIIAYNTDGRYLAVASDKAIQLYDKLLLILSEASMSSEWVKTEIYNARQRELSEKRQMLFPISLASFENIKAWKAFDADTGKDLAREIREYFIPEFANWIDHSSYTRAFDRLIRDLKTLT